MAVLRGNGFKGPAFVIECQRDEIERLRSDVIAFCGPHADRWARDNGLPEGHLHPTHYDILENAGARMVAFTRAEISPECDK